MLRGLPERRSGAARPGVDAVLSPLEGSVLRSELPGCTGRALGLQQTSFFFFFFPFSSFHSGGVMIYFDRIEVVNFLIQSAGEFFPRDPANPAVQSCLCSSC